MTLDNVFLVTSQSTKSTCTFSLVKSEKFNTYVLLDTIHDIAMSC